MKKNGETRYLPRGGCVKKWMLFMRNFLVVFWMSMMSLYASGMTLAQKVSIKVNNVGLKKVIELIEEQTHLGFLYNEKEIAALNKISLNVRDMEVVKVLDLLLEGSCLGYSIDRETILIALKKNFGQDTLRKAREITIKGEVVDEQGVPLPGVTVAVKGLKLGTVTSQDGRFVLSLPKMENMMLIFSFIGMETKEVKGTGKEFMHVVMKETSAQLDEVIVNTGYQRIDLRKTTSAIQSIKAEDIVVSGLQSIDQMLEGYVPGMIFMQNSGQVGATPRLRIRGTSTILGTQEPVWVIDGIVQENPVDIDPEQINDLDFVNLLGNAISGLNPEDIQQIDILKDASATALYGAKAANGVIIVTTKQGRQGPPSLSYSISTTFMRRPHYSESSVNMMNSLQRVDFSRELIEKRVAYPAVSEWLGYEKAIHDYWNGSIDYDEMKQQVNMAESMNTDWFDLLMQNSFSHKHTVSLSGGSSSIRYYVSVGYADNRGSIKGESQKSYTANVNLTANYNRFSMRFSLNGNVGKKEYTPSDVEVMKYAYETSRALSPYGEDGTLRYYKKSIASGVNGDFNIISDMNNSSQDIRSSGLMATASIDYNFSDALKASFTGSYSTNNTTQELWHGENSFYVQKLRATSDEDNKLPQGGELIYQNSERYAYTVRAQLNYSKFVDNEQRHLVTSSVGGEISSNQYYGLEQTYRGYLKERGKKMAAIVLSDYPGYLDWKQSSGAALGAWTDKLTNVASAYATVSYTYNQVYTLNANMRLDASNRFGSRANEKLAPIWSVSARWNIKNDVLKDVCWIANLSLLGSFGYQGNMLESESAKLVLQREGMKDFFNEYYSSVSKYPNPDLKWEKTASYNGTLDFGFFNGRVAGSLSYFYKKTKNAFVQKTITAVMGKDNWVVNDGVVENQGVELGVRINVIDTKRRSVNGFRWTLNPNIGNVFNKVSGKSKDKSLASEVSYGGFLSGSIEVEGRPLNSFYSYKYYCLDATNGLPVFYASNRHTYEGSKMVDLAEKYRDLSLSEVCMDVMTYSGTRVPKIQGGIQNTFAWRNFSMGVNLTYSFGSKIRLLQMYGNVNKNNGTIAPQPTANVRKEFLKRWVSPGDELHTDVPGVVSSSEFLQTLNDAMWWNGLENTREESIAFADNLWTMYDKSDLRTVSGNFVKIQSLSVRYNVPDAICKRWRIGSAYLGFSSTNLHTFCSKKLKGQDPATQDGSAPTINMSLRPTYSFNLNVSF